MRPFLRHYPSDVRIRTRLGLAMTVAATSVVLGVGQNRASAVACDLTFSGSVSSRMSDAANWTPSRTPTPSDYLCIPSGQVTEGPVTGAGIDIEAGAIVYGSLNLTGSAPSRNAGLVRPTTASTLSFGPGGLDNAGTIELYASDVTFTGDVRNAAAGVFTASASARFATGTLTNAGRLDVLGYSSDPVVLTVDAGAFANTGTVHFRSASIRVPAGGVSLGGTGEIEVVPRPPVGTEVPVITFAGTRTGSFASTTDNWVADYASAGAVKLRLQPVLDIVDPSLPVMTIDEAYGPVVLAATGGTGPYVWSLLSATLSGVSVTQQGVIIGTPSGLPGEQQLQISVSDSAGHQWDETFTVEVRSALDIVDVTLPDGIDGSPYGPVTFQVNGGTGPYTWDAVIPSPVSGLSMSTDGVLSGIASALLFPSSSTTIRVTVSDAVGHTWTENFDLTVLGTQTMDIPTDSPLPDGYVGVAYDRRVIGRGSCLASWFGCSRSFELLDGTLPNGLTMDAAGRISGTPTETGTSNFTVRYALRFTVCESFWWVGYYCYPVSNTVDKAFELTITKASPTAPTFRTPNVPDGTVGVAYPGLHVRPATQCRPPRCRPERSRPGSPSMQRRVRSPVRRRLLDYRRSR